MTWVNHARMPAEIRALSPFEQVQAAQAFGVLAYNVILPRTRKTTAITPDMQIVWNRGAHGNKTLSVSGPPADLHPERRIRITAVEAI